MITKTYNVKNAVVMTVFLSNITKRQRIKKRIKKVLTKNTENL
jgi:hypothetical protein